MRIIITLGDHPLSREIGSHWNRTQGLAALAPTAGMENAVGTVMPDLATAAINQP
jgi:hypothetical protein